MSLKWRLWVSLPTVWTGSRAVLLYACLMASSAFHGVAISLWTCLSIERHFVCLFRQMSKSNAANLELGDQLAAITLVRCGAAFDCCRPCGDDGSTMGTCWVCEIWSVTVAFRSSAGPRHVGHHEREDGTSENGTAAPQDLRRRQSKFSKIFKIDT